MFIKRATAAEEESLCWLLTFLLLRQDHHRREISGESRRSQASSGEHGRSQEISRSVFQCWYLSQSSRQHQIQQIQIRSAGSIISPFLLRCCVAQMNDERRATRAIRDCGHVEDEVSVCKLEQTGFLSIQEAAPEVIERITHYCDDACGRARGSSNV